MASGREAYFRYPFFSEEVNVKVGILERTVSIFVFRSVVVRTTRVAYCPSANNCSLYFPLRSRGAKPKARSHFSRSISDLIFALMDGVFNPFIRRMALK